MVRRLPKSLLLFMALLLAIPSLLPPSGQAAEAVMRCSPTAAPCVQAVLPASGLTSQKVYHTLMACCRAGKGGCPMRLACPMNGAAAMAPMVPGASASAHHCLVAIRIIPATPAPVTFQRFRSLLASIPSLLPFAPAFTLAKPPAAATLHFWPYLPVLSLRTLPTLHGLRAPPAALHLS